MVCIAHFALVWGCTLTRASQAQRLLGPIRRLVYDIQILLRYLVLFAEKNEKSR